MLKNLFKEKLLAGDVQIGCWAGMADAYATEMLGTAGFDWLLIDGEHAPNDIRSILAQMQALSNSSSHIMVRLPVGDEALVKQALDIGVQSLMIPMIETVAQAKAMVAACNYPPKGRRGVGASLARASQFSNIPNYLQKANEEICLILQIESLAGLSALDDILQIDGVDGYFIGPSDLAADMGYPGQTGHPEVRAKVIDALTIIKKAGKASGILSTDDNFSKQCIDMGTEFVAVGVDVLQYVTALRTLAAKFIKNSR